MCVSCIFLCLYATFYCKNQDFKNSIMVMQWNMRLLIDCFHWIPIKAFAKPSRSNSATSSRVSPILRIILYAAASSSSRKANKLGFEQTLGSCEHIKTQEIPMFKFTSFLSVFMVPIFDIKKN